MAFGDDHKLHRGAPAGPDHAPTRADAPLSRPKVSGKPTAAEGLADTRARSLEAQRAQRAAKLQAKAGGPTPATKQGKALGTLKGAGNLGANIGKGVSSGDGQTALILLAAAFVILTIARLRGQADIKWQNALFGGFLLAFMLLLLARWSSKMATAFAALVLFQVLVEYGPKALTGLSAGGTGTTYVTSANLASAAPVLGQTSANYSTVASQVANTEAYNAAGYQGPALPTSYSH